MTKKRYRKTARMSRSTKEARCSSPDHYAAALPAGAEEHPVDHLIDDISEVARRRQKLIHMSEHWRDEVRQPRAFIAYEDARLEYSTLRERLYFDVGFEHGRLAGRADSGGVAASTRALAHKLGLAVAMADLPQPHIAAALIDVARAVVLGLPLK